MATIYGGPLLTGTSGADKLFGISGNDTIYGLEGDDEIFGDAVGLGGEFLQGSDTIYGGDGNDTIDPGTGNFADKIFGGNGDDVIGGLFYNPGEGTTVDGGAGIDTFWWTGGLNLTTTKLSNVEVLQASYWPSSVYMTAAQFNSFSQIGGLYGILTVTIAGGGVLDARENSPNGRWGGVISSEGQFSIDVTGRGFSGVTTGTPSPGQLVSSYNSEWDYTTIYDPFGSGFSVSIYGYNVIPNFIEQTTIVGNDSANILRGTSADETIFGLGNADQLFGYDGKDTLDGGAGIDQLTGGAGADIFKFSALTDSVLAGMDRIADFVEGQDKIDLTGLGFTGVTTGIPNAGQLKVVYDSYYKQTYVRDIAGSSFGFYLSGNHLALTNADFIGLAPPGQNLVGTTGNNTLNGGEGDDFISGLAGADRLFGNGGKDILDGGAGVDQLTGGAGADIFKFTAKADSVLASMDRIADFVEGQDKIDLTGLGFTGVTTGNPTVGQLKVSYDYYYKQTYIKDLSGSGFAFYLTGNHTAISNSDIIGLVNAMAAMVPSSANANSALSMQQPQLFDLAAAS